MNDYGIIVYFFVNVIHKILYFYEESYSSKLFKKIANYLKNSVEESFLYKAFIRESRLGTSWENSFLCSFISKLLSLPINAINFMWDKIQPILKESKLTKLFSNSVFGRLVIYVIDRFELLLGGAFLIVAVVDHKYWNNFYSTIISLLLLFLFYIRAIRNKYKGFGIKYIDFSFFAFIFVIITVQITGIFPMDSLKFFIFYLTCFLYVLIITASMRTAKALTSMVEIMLIGISLTGLYGVYQRIRGVPTDPSLVDLTLNAGMPGRIFSTMQNPNSYAQVLILTLPFFAAVIFNAATIRRKLFFICAAVPPVIALFATGSRSAWVALVLAGLVYIFFKEKKLIPIFGVLGVMCIPVVKIVAPAIYLRAMTIFSTTDTSINFRDLIFDTFKPMLKDYWVTGIGLGTGDNNKTFMKLIQNYSLKLVNPYTWSNYVPPHTHNLFYQVWIETGIIGIFSFIWMLFRTFRQSVIAIHKKSDAKAVNLIISGLAGLAGCLLIGTKEYVWFYPRTMVFFFINVGIIFAGIAITKKKQETFAEN